MPQKTKRDWNKREKEIMQKLGVKRQPMSGADWRWKEDGEDPSFLVQLKSTEAGSLTLKLDDVYELIKNAYISNKKPLFVVDFVDHELLVCMRYKDIQPFLDQIRQQE